LSYYEKQKTGTHQKMMLAGFAIGSPVVYPG